MYKTQATQQIRARLTTIDADILLGRGIDPFQHCVDQHRDAHVVTTPPYCVGPVLIAGLPDQDYSNLSNAAAPIFARRITGDQLVVHHTPPTVSLYQRMLTAGIHSNQFPENQ